MTRLQKLTIAVGCLGITLNILGLGLSNETFNYSAVFIGRLAALLFAICIGGVRPYFFIPITISAVNAFHQSPTLIFLEYLTQSIVYQVSAFALFRNKNLSL